MHRAGRAFLSCPFSLYPPRRMDTCCGTRVYNPDETPDSTFSFICCREISVCQGSSGHQPNVGETWTRAPMTCRVQHIDGEEVPRTYHDPCRHHHRCSIYTQYEYFYYIIIHSSCSYRRVSAPLSVFAIPITAFPLSSLAWDYQ